MSEEEYMGDDSPAQGRTIADRIDDAIAAVAKHKQTARAIYLTQEDYERHQREQLDAWRDAHPDENSTVYLSWDFHDGIPIRIGKRSQLFSKAGVTYGISDLKRRRMP